MKSKLLNTARLLSIFLVSALTFVFVSCDKTETTDSTGFILHYLGVTDIGPSMSYTLKAPAYKGSAPYDFTITNVTFNDETYSNNDNFVINAETGEITIQNTEAMEPGLYSISVGCYSNGKFYSFKDAVQVNMLLAVPEGVSVEPAEVLVKMEDENWWEASAQVTTDAEKHVSITKYEFAEDESKEYIKYFTISNTGVITFNPDHKDKIIPGEKYILSLKLTTKAGEHLYPDAVTFNVISKPLNLLYKPNTVRVEQNTAHESQLPTIQGSEGMTYAIKSITPEATGFTIDEKTGKISLAENSPLNIDNVYKIDVTVTNEYGSTDFAEAYTVTIVDFIEPIQPETFTYEVPANMYEEKAYTIKLNPNFVGGEAIFSLENNTGAIQEQINNKKIEIDILKGDIYILADNTLVPDNYVINAKVVGPTADKGEATVSIAFTISANPNKFTFYYGNNLGLPEKDNANQYAFKSKAEMKNTTIVPTTTLNGKTAKWKIYRKTLMGGSSEVAIGKDTDINETTGELIFKESGFINVNTVGMLIVEATCGTGEDAYTATAPVFIKTYNPNYDSSKQPAIIEYKPFVLQVNPKKGGQSVEPTITATGGADLSKFAMDYRKDFNFFSINTDTEGVIPSTTGSILNDVWKSFYESVGVSINTGAKRPMSYYDNPNTLDKTLGYINPTDKKVIIQPNLWKDANGEYANGVLIGRISYITDEKTEINNGKLCYPIAIWFDENFE